MNSFLEYHKYLLEQSGPCLPVSHMQVPVTVLQRPALLQLPGQVNSEKYVFNMTRQTKLWINSTLPEQSDPWFPSLQVHRPVVWSHWPLPLQGGMPPGQDLSVSNSNQFYKVTGHYFF